MSLKSIVQWLLPSLVVLVFVFWTVVHPASTSVIEKTPQRVCSLSGDLSIVGSVDKQTVIKDGKNVKFFANGWISMVPCNSGIVSFTASADSANNIGADLVVITDGSKNMRYRISDPTQINLGVESNKETLIGYTNDTYRAQSRFAIIKIIGFSGVKCNSFIVDTQFATDVEWIEQERRLGFSGGSPISLTPCSSGVLAIDTFGSSFDVTMPVLTISQETKIVSTIGVSRLVRRQNLRIGNGVVTIKLINPLNRVVVDRNLYLNDVSFARE